MLPASYALRYYELTVPIVVDDKVTRWQQVNLNHYVLVVKIDKDTGMVTWDDNHADNQAAYDAMLGKLKHHFAKKAATLTVHVKPVDGGIEHSEFDTWHEVWYYARKAFFGKGSPEEAQITLQLAARFGLLNGGDLQTYCNDYLGLDCNGFVGNYLVHGLREQDWQLAEPMGTDCLASKTVGEILRNNGAPVMDVDDLVPANTYLMGRVGASGRVIERVEGNAFAHIIITQPGIMSEWAYTDGDKVRQVPTMCAVESTGGAGLVAKPCKIVSVTPDGIFSIKRLSHPFDEPLGFRAYRVL